MARLQRDDMLAAHWVKMRELSTTGKPQEALELVEQLLADASDPFRTAQALIAQATILNNMGNRKATLPLLNPVEKHLHAAAHPRLFGQYHLLVAAIAYEGRSYSVALQHLVHTEQALERMGEHTQAAVYAWHDLAESYSRLGLHARAVQADQRAQSLSARLEEPATADNPSVSSLQAAVYLDQRGNADGCVHQLTDLVEHSAPHIEGMTLVGRVVLSYAVRRLAALDRPVAVEVPAASTVGPLLTQINTLGDVCDALSARRPHDALALLDAAGSLAVLGTAEPLRLRSLARAQLGDYAGALEAERAVLLTSSQEEHQLRALLADSAHARIDQEKLRQTAERHARAALTDPLTGLPNRRKLDEFFASLTTAGHTSAIGMLDVDRFKIINDNHGHPTGDTVLQRIAGILAREVRPRDLLVRTGGDEFVIVLPGATPNEAQALGAQIEAAVRNEDWSTVVPDTPIEVSTGWAPLDSDIDAALRIADTALYQNKREHARPLWTDPGHDTPRVGAN
jgi:diguanylate cyclase (GGDEF)-like protein